MCNHLCLQANFGLYVYPTCNMSLHSRAYERTPLMYIGFIWDCPKNVPGYKPKVSRETPNLGGCKGATCKIKQ